MFASVFTDINLPNPTTWFYFSGLLAVALFFKFDRVFSIRNLDVLTLYLFAPGMLLVGEGGSSAFYGYLALMVASLYFLGRCLFDLALVRRPALGPNLDFAGLAWLAGTMFISLVAVTARQPVGPHSLADQPKAAIDKLPQAVEKAIEPRAPADLSRARLRAIVERTLALLCHLSVVVGLVLVGARTFDSVQAGMSAATFYLLLPYNFNLVPDSPLGMGRWDHAWPMAFLVWSVLCYRRPILAGLFLGLATGTAFFLVAMVPAWWSFYGARGGARFLLSFVVSAGLGLTLLGGVLWLNGELPRSLQSDWTTADWQPWRKPSPKTSSIWQELARGGGDFSDVLVKKHGLSPTQQEEARDAARKGGAKLGEVLVRLKFATEDQIKAAEAEHAANRLSPGMAAYRVPVFVASMALIGLSLFWPRPKNLGHVVALSAAVLISFQFWYADRGGVYVLWFLPLLLLLVFRPNLTECVPADLPKDDWPARLGAWVQSLAVRAARLLTTPASRRQEEKAA